MNRPKFEDYKWKHTTQWKYDVFGYRANVEKYCDELELKNLELEKALDKACDLLANELNACCNPNEDFTKECGVNCKKHWKEWLMKDE